MKPTLAGREPCTAGVVRRPKLPWHGHQNQHIRNSFRWILTNSRIFRRKNRFLHACPKSLRNQIISLNFLIQLLPDRIQAAVYTRWMRMLLVCLVLRNFDSCCLWSLNNVNIIIVVGVISVYLCVFVSGFVGTFFSPIASSGDLRDAVIFRRENTVR